MTFYQKRKQVNNMEINFLDENNVKTTDHMNISHKSRSKNRLRERRRSNRQPLRNVLAEENGEIGVGACVSCEMSLPAAPVVTATSSPIVDITPENSLQVSIDKYYEYLRSIMSESMFNTVYRDVLSRAPQGKHLSV